MAYYNENENENFYPIIPAADNVDIYPDLNTGADYTLSLDTWDVNGPNADPLTVMPDPNNYSLEVPGIQYPTQNGHCVQPTHPGQNIPEVQPQPQPAGLPEWDGFVATGVASEPPVVAPVPSNDALGRWGEHPSRYPLNAYYQQNVFIPYQPNTGPARTRFGKGRRFQPYGTQGARPTEHVGAGAGQLTSVPPHIPSAGPLATQPPGGIPETPADAGKTQNDTEKDKTPKLKPAKVPRGQGKPRAYRLKVQGKISILLQWAQQREFLQDPPTINVALAIAVEAVSEAREMLHKEPYLKLTGAKDDTDALSRHMRTERERRATERGLYQELTKYYPRESRLWTIPGILSRVVEDLETHPKLKIPSGPEFVEPAPVWIPQSYPNPSYFIATTGF